MAVLKIKCHTNHMQNVNHRLAWNNLQIGSTLDEDHPNISDIVLRLNLLKGITFL